jgi:parvulin-like peptidyl-prolyl isomerase
MWSRNAAYSISENDAVKVSASLPNHGLIVIQGKVSENITPLYKVRQMSIRNRYIEAGWYFNVSDFRIDNWGDLVPTVHELELGETFRKDDLVAIPVENLAEGLYFFTTRFAVVQRSALRGNINQPQEGYLISVGAAHSTAVSEISANATTQETVIPQGNLPNEHPSASSGAGTYIQIDNQSAPYQLAEKLSATIPALAPESRTILAEDKSFGISAYEAIISLYNNQGSRASQLTTLGFDQLKQVILNEARGLGERRLITEAAKQASLSVTAEEVEKVLQNEYSRAGGEDNYATSLRTEGISMDFVKHKTNETLLINKYLAQVSNNAATKAVSVPSQTATVRHILLLTQGKAETDKSEIRKKAEELLRRAKSGEDFAQLARQYSEDPGSKDQGGLYENFKRGVMVKSFEEAAFSIPVGEIGEIVETQYGYHIIKVIGRSGPAQATNEATLGQDANTVQGQIDRLKEEAGFRVYPERLKK